MSVRIIDRFEFITVDKSKSDGTSLPFGCGKKSRGFFVEQLPKRQFRKRAFLIVLAVSYAREDRTKHSKKLLKKMSVLFLIVIPILIGEQNDPSNSRNLTNPRGFGSAKNFWIKQFDFVLIKNPVALLENCQGIIA